MQRVLAHYGFSESDAPFRSPLPDHTLILLTRPQTLERVRRSYDLLIVGYVVTPEHVHLLVGEPERASLAVCPADAQAGEAFWQKRYYDFNVWSEASG